MPGRRARTLVLVTVAVAVVASAAAVAAGGARVDAVAAKAHVRVALTLTGLSWCLAGAVVAWHRPRNRLGWLLLVVGAVTQISVAEEALVQAGLAERTTAGLAGSVLAGTGLFLLIGLLPMLYPAGRLPSGGARWPAVLVVIGTAAQQLQWVLSQLAGWRWPFDPGAAAQASPADWLPFAVYVAGAVAGWLLCLRRAWGVTGTERQQLVLLLVAVVLTLSVSPLLGTSDWEQLVQALILYLLPAAIVVGILRYRLLGIELVLRRGLVYGTLTVAVVAVYALATSLGGARVGGDRVPGFVAAALVAVGLLPVRDIVQRGVDRLLYGAGRDPVTALASLASLVAQSGPGSLADQLVAGVRNAVRAAGVTAVGPDGSPLARAGAAPPYGQAAVRLPLVVEGEELGVLLVAPRSHGERYPPADLALLSALGPQVAVALRAVETAAALERERDAVVAVRQDERERLRRELHDGLGPSLTGIGLGLRAVDDAASAADLAQVRRLGDVLRAEIGGAVDEVRRIIDDLRPGALEQHDLGAALERALCGYDSSPRVRVVAAEMPRLPPLVEDAVYRVALEAVNNARRHAAANSVQVRLAHEEAGLLLEVTDDGVGIPSRPVEGVGLASMRARAAAVGGVLELVTGSGTTVRLLVPAPTWAVS